MTKIIIAFDIDGTLLNNEGVPPQTPTHLRPPASVNLEAVILLQILSKMKNTKIYVWSGGGQEYAENFVRRYGLERYVDKVLGKADYTEIIHGHIDVCFDDIHDCEMADKNIIVKFK